MQRYKNFKSQLIFEFNISAKSQWKSVCLSWYANERIRINWINYNSDMKNTVLFVEIDFIPPFFLNEKFNSNVENHKITCGDHLSIECIFLRARVVNHSWHWSTDTFSVWTEKASFNWAFFRSKTISQSVFQISSKVKSKGNLVSA